MPLSEEQKREYLLSKGLDPAQYDVEEVGVGVSEPTEAPTQGTPFNAFTESIKRTPGPLAGSLAGMRLGAKVPLPGVWKALPILAGGLVGGFVGGKGQEAITEAIQGPEEYQKDQEKYSRLREAHKIASTVGDLLPFSIPFGSGGLLKELGKLVTPATISKKVLGQAGLGAAFGAGTEGIREYVQDEEFDPVKIALHGVGGAFQNEPTRIGKKLLGPKFPGVQPEVESLHSIEEFVAPKEVISKPKEVEVPATVEKKDFLTQQKGIESLRKEMQGEEVKPSLATDKDTPEIRSGEPANRPQVEEDYIQDPTEKFYQENKKGPFNLRKDGSPVSYYTGVVDNYDSVKATPHGYSSLNKHHKDFGFPEQSQRWRYFSNTNKVKWTDTPSESAIQAVENFLAKKNIYPDKHIGYGEEIYNNTKQFSEVGPGQPLTPEQFRKAQELAKQRGVKLEQEPGIISEVTGKEARGYAIPEDRRAVINPDRATTDTPAHEVAHNYINDLRNSTRREDVEFYNKGIKAAGSEEKLVEALGKRNVEINNRPLRTWIDDAKNYVGSKLKLTEENPIQALGRRLADDRPYKESPELHKSTEEFKKKLFSEEGESGGRVPATSSRTGGGGITTGPLKSVIDSIAEHSPKAAKAAEAADRDMVRFNGEITNKFDELTAKIKDPKAMTYIWEMNTSGKSSHILNPKDKALIDGELFNAYKNVHEIQRREGLKINGRDAIDNPNRRGPNSISQNVLDTIIHKPQTSVERRKLINDWKEFKVKVGDAKNLDEAQEQFNEWFRGFSAAGTKNKTASFNALRMAEGKGIPLSWMETDIRKAFHNYGKRASRDLGYWKNIESKPEIAALFGHESIPGVEPVGGQAIQTAQKVLTGQHTTSDVVYNAIESFVRSLILGPATGIRNTVDLFAQIMPYMPARDLPRLVEAAGKIKKGFADSMKMGVNRHHTLGIETGEMMGGVNRFAQNLRGLSDLIRKYTGANSIEQWTRAYNMALGEVLTESNIGLAAKGDINARKFLRQFAPEGSIGDDFKTPLSEADKLETAARFVERVQGTYGLRGLPSFLMEPSTPAYWFMSLSKWSVERANIITKDVINPALKGEDFGPLIRYTLGGLLTGEAIRAVTEELNNKKINTPNLQELQDKGDVDDYLYKAVELSGLAGLGGMYSDILKMIGDVAKGNHTRGYTIPSYELAKDMAGEIGAASKAISEGQDGVAVILTLAQNILTDNIQALRMVSNSINQEEMDRADRFRDKRVYDKLDGKNVPAPQGRADRYGGKAEREFKRAKTKEEAQSIYKEDIEPRLKELPKEERKEKISGLKRNSYQTVPSDPKEAREYYNYIRRTQGIDAMMRLKKDKEEQDKVNKQKTRGLR